MIEPIYWLNGRLVSAAEAVIPLNDHGLLYGDGVFEGIRFYNRRPFRLADHLERLELSARALMLALPHRTALEAAVTETIAAFAGADGYLRLVITRGAGSLGLDPGHCERPSLFVIADKVTLVSESRRRSGLDLITASTRRPGPTVLDPRIKSLNYLNNILAKLEARRAGADEALLLNERGQVAEGTAENLFIARRGRLCTPPVSDGALDGITRGIVLELCRQEGIEAVERSLTPYDVHTADECFLCGTGAELLPVRTVDGRPMGHCPGPLTERVRRAYQAIIELETTTRSEQ
ncbi:MAG: branched-chain-amino-acid transaminase [Zoogloea oleivorans]|jgi:branched-chain amino acid aminotransferase|uniref:branched-chain-amino-acid transaminase n=1 Tax=Zoogloea oleivorans TaxID=1552750 RepID=UPI002A35DD87|nr:branched-chain-amino-acid transaminase [Zoogloea oleivorans]MDY0036613.1 branched-chain-amino-acid transaminase [Zoogloea oleivorans]